MQNQLARTEQSITPVTESKVVEFVPFGAAESIKLSIKIIRDYIAVATRSGKLPDDRDCMKFMMLCRARHLNPFEGDAFLLGYDSNSGPSFSLITAHQVFLKRAEASASFDGMESGVIIEAANADPDLYPMIHEREGDFTMAGEKLLGGWAKVYRRDRARPVYRRLKLETFSTGRSRWEKDAAGMIVKCAEADALRSSFPTHLGGLYMREETPAIDISEIPSARIGMPKTPLEALPAKSAKPVVDLSEESEPRESGDEEPEQEKPKAKKPSGGAPTAPELLKTITARLAQLNIGKGLLNSTLAELGWMKDGQHFETQDAATLASFLDGWDQIVEHVKGN